MSEVGTLKDKRMMRSRKLDLENLLNIEVKIPKGKNEEEVLNINLSDTLLINKDLPPEILQKLANCAITYARIGSVKADLDSYLDLIEAQFDVWFKTEKSKIRDGMAKPTEGKIEEQVIINNKEKYLDYKKKIRLSKKAIECIKRVMYSLEILSEASRTIISYSKKEWEMISSGEPSVKKSRSQL